MMSRIPLSVITGFLGSGKTTLLNRLLDDPRLSDAVVLINEWGEVGIDHLLVRRIDENVVLLPSGCLCCALRSDLVTTMRDLYTRSLRGAIPRFARMLIETTGLADPAPVLHTLIKDALIAERFRLDGTITTVDAVHAVAQLDRHPESVKQVALADRLVLTKGDLVDRRAAAAVTARLRRINPTAPILRALHGKTDVARLLDAGLYDAATRRVDIARWLQYERYESSYARHRPVAAGVGPRDDRVRSYCLTFGAPIQWDAFAAALRRLAASHGAKLLRIKGILNVQGQPLPVVVHGVHHLFHQPQLLPAWPDEERRSRVVFITLDVERQVAQRAFQELNPQIFSPRRAGRHASDMPARAGT